MYTNPPCAACKFLRKKCTSACVFAPHFPPEDSTKFINVHKVFGSSNVAKLLKEIPPPHREAAVYSLAYEAELRLKDPVYGCAGAITVLHNELISLQKELDATNAHIMLYAGSPEILNNYGSGFVDPNYSGFSGLPEWSSSSMGLPRESVDPNYSGFSGLPGWSSSMGFPGESVDPNYSVFSGPPGWSSSMGFPGESSERSGHDSI